MKKTNTTVKVILILAILFLLKNIILFTINQLEIKHLKQKLVTLKEENLVLVDDIKNIKTDTFVIRYAIDNLNLKLPNGDLSNLLISEDELDIVKKRIDLGIFGKKFENVPIP